MSVSQSVVDLKYDDIDWLMGINFFGVVSGTKAFLPAMLRENRGVIVNVSSIFGVVAIPSQSMYNASKFAVRGFTESLQWELAARGSENNVWAMCVMPGGVATNVARSARFYLAPDGKSDLNAAMARFDSVARTSPESAAQQIIAAITEKKQRRLFIGHDARALSCLQRVLPGSYWKVLDALQHLQTFVEKKTQAGREWWAGSKGGGKTKAAVGKKVA